MKTLTYSGLITVLLMSAGCADGNHRPYALDDSFGKSVTHMAKASTYDPQAAQHPLPDDPQIMDGYAGVSTIGSYRSSFGQAIQNQGLTINIGGTSGSSSGSSSGGSSQ